MSISNFVGVFSKFDSPQVLSRSVDDDEIGIGKKAFILLYRIILPISEFHVNSVNQNRLFFETKYLKTDPTEMGSSQFFPDRTLQNHPDSLKTASQSHYPSMQANPDPLNARILHRVY